MNKQITLGSRNNALFKMGIAQRDKGRNAEQIERGLIKVNEQYCRPPLPDNEVRSIARAVCKAGTVLQEQL